MITQTEMTQAAAATAVMKVLVSWCHRYLWDLITFQAEGRQNDFVYSLRTKICSSLYCVLSTDIVSAAHLGNNK